MRNKTVNRIVISALFAALTYVATSVIRIPIDATGGYINIGDTIVLLSAWLIGGSYGALAAGIGSALADLLAGYSVFVPGTFIIKFLMALAAFVIFTAVRKSNINKIVGYIISGLAAELIMVFGYFIYESMVLGYGLGAAASIAGNFIQAGVSVTLGYIVIGAFEKTKAVSLIKNFI